VTHPDYTAEDLNLETDTERLLLSFVNEKRRKYRRLRRWMWAIALGSLAAGMLIENGMDLLP
jgi:hypothetical protein